MTKKKELCRCDRCDLFRAKGIRSRFTPKECREIREYAAAMMRQVRSANV